MRYTCLQVLKTKDEAFEAYKSFAAWAQTQHGVHIKCLHSDHSGEFMSNQFTAYLHQQGSECRLTTVDTPQHNGVAKSLNRRLMEHTRTILHQSDLSKYLWAEAIQFVVWLKNRTSTKTLGISTPHE
jgi:transposase InsO family protein